MNFLYKNISFRIQNRRLGTKNPDTYNPRSKNITIETLSSTYDSRALSSIINYKDKSLNFTIEPGLIKVLLNEENYLKFNNIIEIFFGNKIEINDYIDSLLFKILIDIDNSTNNELKSLLDKSKLNFPKYYLSKHSMIFDNCPFYVDPIYSDEFIIKGFIHFHIRKKFKKYFLEFLDTLKDIEYKEILKSLANFLLDFNNNHNLYNLLYEYSNKSNYFGYISENQLFHQLENLNISNNKNKNETIKIINLQVNMLLEYSEYLEKDFDLILDIIDNKSIRDAYYFRKALEKKRNENIKKDNPEW